MNPSNTIFDIKRLLGRRFSEPTVQADMEHWPFKVISKGDDKPVIVVQYQGETKQFLPEEISAMVLWPRWRQLRKVIWEKRYTHNWFNYYMRNGFHCPLRPTFQTSCIPLKFIYLIIYFFVGYKSSYYCTCFFQLLSEGSNQRCWCHCR